MKTKKKRLCGHSSIVRTCIVLSCVFLTSRAIAADEPNRPNVLMIVVDDLNDWVEPLGGHPQVKTPAIKSLAERGMNFRNAHCQSPLCNPSRTSVMLSLRPSTTGIYGLDPWFRSLESLRRKVSMPQYFHRAGYETYTCGKVYHNNRGAIRRRASMPSLPIGGLAADRESFQKANSRAKHQAETTHGSTGDTFLMTIQKKEMQSLPIGRLKSWGKCRRTAHFSCQSVFSYPMFRVTLLKNGGISILRKPWSYQIWWRTIARTVHRSADICTGGYQNPVWTGLASMMSTATLSALYLAFDNFR